MSEEVLNKTMIYRLLRYRKFMSALGLVAILSFVGNLYAQVNSGSGLASTPPLGATSSATPTSPSRVIAKVNGLEITVADINVATDKDLRGVGDPVVISRVKKQALNDLIQETLASTAFDRSAASQSPENIKRVERLKRQAVMNFYLSSNAVGLPKPDPRKIENYLQKHPELVAARQKFHYSQILIDTSTIGNLAQVEKLVQDDPTLEKLNSWIKENKVPSVRNNFWRSTDQLNSTTVASLKALKKGAIGVEQSKNQNGIVVLRLYDSYSDPATLEEAYDNIYAGAEEEMRNQFDIDLLADLRAKADIQVVDPEFLNDDPLPVTSSERIIDEPKGTFASKILITWLFAMLVLLPVVLVAFYRHQIISTTEGINLSHEELENPEFLRYQSHSKLIRRLIVIPLLLPVAYWLTMPLLDFFQYPPAGIGLQKIIILAISGILLGCAVVASCMKLTKLRLWTKSGWLGLSTLIGIQFIFFWFDIHA